MEMLDRTKTNLIARYSYRIAYAEGRFIDKQLVFHVRQPKWMPSFLYKFLMKEMIVFQVSTSNNGNKDNNNN